MENHELISFGDLPVSDLMHHGIKGMKWGVRRYQNKDGTLTAAGKKRQAKLEERRDKLDGKLNKLNSKKRELGLETPEEKKERILKSRSAKALYDNADLFTDAELQKAYNRLTLENNVKNLAPKEVSKGQKFVDKYNTTGKNINDVIETTGKLYNSAAKVYNTFFKGEGKPWPTFGQNDKSNKKSVVDKLKEEYQELDYRKKIADLKAGKKVNQTSDIDELRELNEELMRQNQELLKNANG